ncbi:MAG: DNA-binding protein, partial [Planctomycetota bacterium]|nr:DNA-binding protein [Planctomycetota bacterium]
RSLLHREFVRSGSIPKELGKHFDLLFDSWQEGDYADLVVFHAEEVSGWLAQTKTFVSHIEALVSDTA